MNKMKYIIAKMNLQEVPIIFPDGIKHSDIPVMNVVSGGFVSIKSIPEDAEKLVVNECAIVNDIEVYCHGQSVSTNCSSKNHIDEELIKKMIVGGYYQRINEWINNHPLVAGRKWLGGANE